MRLKEQEQDEEFYLLEYNISEEQFDTVLRDEESEGGGECSPGNVC
jgi:hypothetical protein